MNLSEVKVALGVETINLNVVKTEEGVATPWLKDWNNTERVAILIHKDTLALVKADAKLVTLGINTQVKQGNKGEYIAKTICIYKEADETL